MDDPGLVEGRFEVERQVAAGGMGVIYRALDRVTGELVALKLLRSADRDSLARFGLEARVLAGLDHPGIVKYVAHGALPDGASYLAMEWLDGLVLTDRLGRGGLTTEEVVQVVAAIADALGAAHARGVVHRDIKPANVFLVGGRADAVKVLDFGVARVTTDGALGLTRTGALVGTPAYMSPEQARGSHQIDYRTDLFSLGTLLFECLTGRLPFAAAHAVGVMAKIVFEDAPRLAAFRPDLPPALDLLVGRLLARERSARPSSAAEVSLALRRLGHLGDVRPVPIEPRAGHTAAVTHSENRLVCVVLAVRPELPILVAPHGGDSARAETLRSEQATDHLSELARVAALHEARLEPLLDGSIAALLVGGGAARDLCQRGARLALALRQLLPGARIALATGRGVVAANLPLGEVIEQAAALLPQGGAWPVDAPVHLDAVTAGLVESSFEVRVAEGRALLVGEREPDAEARRLLGRTTPLVGRERELRTLDALYAECLDEGVGRAALVTGGTGVGKSRLGVEFIRRVRQEARAEVWIARGDPVHKGSPLALLAQVLRRTAEVHDGDPPEAAYRKLRARVARHVAAEAADRVSEFLGELCGVAARATASPQLRAALENPVLMGDQMRRAWEDFVTAECAAHPVVLVVEDLHWGDLPTTRFIDAALRRAVELPLCVVALARNEVDELFPGLWAERGLTQIRLAELSRKAAEKLIVFALGERVDAAGVARLVELAGGNAFFLEELIRAVADGGPDAALPTTVLAVAQARLEVLAEPLRRLLRAASVFGGSFWKGGVASLLGEETQEVDLTEGLSELVRREVLVPAGESRFDGEAELGFRHALLREAAYAMLTEHDRAQAHKNAGEWLERAGAQDALELAEHYERGAAPKRALDWFRRAAEQAVEANDLDAALVRVDRAERSGARGEALGRLRLIEAAVHHWKGRYHEGQRCAVEAMRHLPPLTPAWYRAAEEVAETSLPLGKIDRLAVLAESLHPPPSGAPEPAGAFVMAAATVSMQLALSGQRGPAAQVLGRMESQAARLEAAGRLALLPRARRLFAHATWAVVEGDVGRMLRHALDATTAFDEAGDLRNAALMRTNVAYAWAELGRYAEAEAVLRVALENGERIAIPAVVGPCKQNLGLVLLRLGRLAEAAAIEAEAAAWFATTDDRRQEGLARVYLAQVALAAGDLDAALAQAEQATQLHAAVPLARPFALATLAEVRRARGDAAGAAAAAAEAHAQLTQLGGIDEGEAFVRLVHVETLPAGAERDAALALAREQVCARAARISDEDLRASFVRDVAENARTLTLA